MFSSSLLRRLRREGAQGARTGLTIAAATALIFGLAACGGSSSGPSATSSETKTIRLGYEEGYPTSYPNSIATSVFEKLGYKVELVPMAFEALIPSLQSGRIDAAGSGIYITPPRCKAAAFSEPLLLVQNSIAVPKGNPHNLQTLEDIAKTGVTMGVAAGTDMARAAAKAGVKESQISTYQDLNTMLDAVLSGRVDAAPYDIISLAPALAKPAYAGLEATTPMNPTFDDGEKRPYGSAIAFQKDKAELAKQYSEKQTELFLKEGEKAAGFAKEGGIALSSVPKGDEPFKMEDYCAHAGA